MLADLPLPVDLSVPGVRLRRAGPLDLDELIAMLAEDEIGRGRGDVADPADRDRYAAALAAVLADPGNDLVVAVADGRVIGTLQLTLIPGLARRGATRLLVEAVRVSAARRSGGIGTALMRWVLDEAAPATGADLVQLTSDAARTEAHRFYERLGFVGSHLGFKYRL